ncbi:glutathione S-transferase family protein [Sorangium sp. So ce1036]|uniref:glutathione S-transferase family protein n=1 Tax=Sorangium sp. So ce1036 TaxID=3133328 RepID=UPI003F0981AC
MIKLYEYAPSGNCYKVRLLLSHLGIPLERVAVDLHARASRTPEFLAKNPNGRVPVVELEPGRYLAESNAILWYFAEGTGYLPEDRLGRAEALQWMFFEQYSHEPYVAVVRAWVAYFGVPQGKEQELVERRERGYAALDVMERHLVARSFFVGERYGIADIALYAYTHVADEGGFDLARYPGIGAWMARVKAQPRHVSIKE